LLRKRISCWSRSTSAMRSGGRGWDLAIVLGAQRLAGNGRLKLRGCTRERA
jgi:hypothetical protein